MLPKDIPCFPARQMFKCLVEQRDAEPGVPDDNGGIGIGNQVVQVFLCFMKFILDLNLFRNIIRDFPGSNDSAL